MSSRKLSVFSYRRVAISQRNQVANDKGTLDTIATAFKQFAARCSRFCYCQSIFSSQLFFVFKVIRVHGTGNERSLLSKSFVVLSIDDDTKSPSWIKRAQELPLESGACWVFCAIDLSLAILWLCWDSLNMLQCQESNKSMKENFTSLKWTLRKIYRRFLMKFKIRRKNSKRFQAF